MKLRELIDQGGNDNTDVLHKVLRKRTQKTNPTKRKDNPAPDSFTLPKVLGREDAEKFSGQEGTLA